MAGIRITVFHGQAIAEAITASAEGRAEIAELVAGDARASAPVRSGEYRGGIHTEISGDDVRVVDDDPEAFWKEYGTVDTPSHAALTDAARKHGRYSGFQPRNR